MQRLVARPRPKKATQLLCSPEDAQAYRYCFSGWLGAKSHAIDEMELPLHQGTSLLLILTSFTLRTTSNSLDLDLLCMELKTLLRVENRI